MGFRKVSTTDWLKKIWTSPIALRPSAKAAGGGRRYRGGRSAGRTGGRSAGRTRWGHGGGRGKRGGAAARKEYRRKVDEEWASPNDVGVERKEDMLRVLNGKPEAIRTSAWTICSEAKMVERLIYFKQLATATGW